MTKIIEDIRNELVKNADEKTRKSGERFFREEVKLYGLKSAAVTKIGREFYKRIPDKNKVAVFDLCDELWRSGYLEETGIACMWSYNVSPEYKPDDIRIFEGWINNYVTNWASCDTLCNHSVGTLIEMYPQSIIYLKKWTKSQNRWVRRASAVSLIIPARKGLFPVDVFEIADSLLSDTDDMVQKGYGWMLKSASQAYQKAVFDYVVKHKAVMPRTSLRYAIEKMPRDLKLVAMAR